MVAGGSRRFFRTRRGQIGDANTRKRIARQPCGLPARRQRAAMSMAAKQDRMAVTLFAIPATKSTARHTEPPRGAGDPARTSPICPHDGRSSDKSRHDRARGAAGSWAFRTRTSPKLLRQRRFVLLSHTNSAPTSAAAYRWRSAAMGGTGRCQHWLNGGARDVGVVVISSRQSLELGRLRRAPLRSCEPRRGCHQEQATVFVQQEVIFRQTIRRRGRYVVPAGRAESRRIRRDVGASGSIRRVRARPDPFTEASY